MSPLVLLGSPKTKRTVYLERAAAEAGVETELADWKDFPGSVLEKLEGAGKIFLKIDPPLWDSCRLDEMEGLVSEYTEALRALQEAGREGRICFLNEPEAIEALLDKRQCKRRLEAAGLPVTEELEIKLYGAEGEEPEEGTRYPLAERLRQAMEKNRVSQVFIKPNRGSGAAGVMALRCRPGRGQMVLYTCAAKDPATGRLVNTKRLRRFTDTDQILSLIDRLLRLDCVVERWHPKARYQGFSYDLRAVVQDHQVDFLLARLSAGPVTNLHLNNRPLRAEELGLPRQVTDSVYRLCLRAAECYPGLRSAGIDLLLERGSLRPRIIEMNGQGDLIYQDIYNDNRIYRRQAEMMKEWLWKNQR